VSEKYHEDCVRMLCAENIRTIFEREKLNGGMDKSWLDYEVVSGRYKHQRIDDEYRGWVGGDSGQRSRFESSASKPAAP